MTMWNTEICLIRKDTSVTDEIGQPIRVEQRTRVLAQKRSITNAMLFYAKEFGFKPTLVVAVHSFEYNHEPVIEFEGVLYDVKRVYEENDDLTELQCERRRVS